MRRSTKIGVWLLPWLPVFFIAFAIFAWIQSGHPHTDFVYKQPDGHFKWTTELEPWEYNIIMTGRVVLPISAAAFLAGVVLLVLALVRRVREHGTSSV